MPATNRRLKDHNAAIAAPPDHNPPAALVEQYEPLILERHQPKRKRRLSLHLIEHHIAHLLELLEPNGDEVLIIVDLFILEYQWPAIAQHYLHSYIVRPVPASIAQWASF